MAQGQISTLSETTVTPKRTLSDIIKIIDPSDIPLLTMLGTSQHTKVRMQNWPNNKYEWLEGTLNSTTTLAAEAIDNSETTIDVDDSSVFRPGDVVQVDDEKMWISAVDTSANPNTITVTRGYGDTSAATHDDNSTITYLFPARLEGTDSNDQPYNAPTALYNYAQIFQAELRASGSELNASTRYGMDDLLDYRRLQLMGGYGGGDGKAGNAGELLVALEKVFYSGERVLRTAGLGGAAGGVPTFVTTNVTAMSGAALDPVTLENAIEDCWQAGGKPRTIICNSWARRKITSFYAGNVRTERSEATGGILIDTIHTQFGDLRIVMSRLCPAAKLFIIQDEKIGWCTLRDWFEEPLAKVGDYERRQIVGEFGFIVENEKCHAIISGFSTSS